MKKKFVLVSKVILGIFLVLFFIILMDMGYATEGKSIEATAYVLFPCLFFGALTLIVLLIQAILEIKERWKEKGARLAAELAGQVVIIWAAIAIFDTLILKEDGTIKGYLVASIGVVITSKVLDYWKRVRKNRE